MKQVSALGILVLLMSCTDKQAPAPVAALVPARAAMQDSTFQPILPPTGLDPAAVALGYTLFHDKRLSRDRSLSCASCHDLSQGGDDGRPRSRGIGGIEGEMNAPTVYNAAVNFRQFWDGRVETLEEQVDGPVQNRNEMSANWVDVTRTLAADAALAGRFAAVYPDTGLTPETVRSAIATFERALVTPGAPFDRYLGGDSLALSESAARGFVLFNDLGCSSCHQGVAVGGNMFQVFGLMIDREQEQRERDLGRFAVTGRPEDRHVFKVPSLRNVALTAPYFHDGSVADLRQVVRIMGEYQLGRELAGAEVDDLHEFLLSLTAPMPKVARDGTL